MHRKGTSLLSPCPPRPFQLTFCLTLVQLASASLQRLWMVTLQAGGWGGAREGGRVVRGDTPTRRRPSLPGHSLRRPSSQTFRPLPDPTSPRLLPLPPSRKRGEG